jgi:hypothetical protein
VKVAVYVHPQHGGVTVDKVPPLTSIKELLNLVVGVLILNVTVAVSPGVNVVSVEVISHSIVIARVSI